MTIEHEERQGVRPTLFELIQSSEAPPVIDHLDNLSPAEVALEITALDPKDQTRLLELIGPEKSASIISKISGMGATAIIGRIPVAAASPIFEEMEGNQQVDYLRKLKGADADAILQNIQPEKANEIRQRMRYPENSAGALMITEYLYYSGNLLVRDVLEDLHYHGEAYSELDIQYAYVISDTGKLTGVLRLRDLLLAPRTRPINEVMIKEPLKVNINTPLQELRDFFREYSFLGVPVTDDEGNIVGVVRSSVVKEAAIKRNNKIFLKFAGIIGGEELRTMPLYKRSSRRLSWLSINIVLNIVAASVIALYQDTLEKAIVLAVFLPIISDMSGCSGNQAVAVSIRELTQGLVRPREILRVLAKESSIGVINGIVLGCLLGGAALLWKGNPYLGLVVAVALAANTLVAVSFGGIVPLILSGIRTDPALASGPLLTTITDMCGFFFVLSFASLLLPRLSG
jgi:magnesium transporter